MPDSTNVVWTVSSGSSTSASTSNTITWTSSSGSTGYLGGAATPAVRIAPPRPRSRIRPVEQPVEQEERQAARRRARALLLEHLSQEQREQYEEHEAFLAEAPSGRRYLILYGMTSNVAELDENNRQIARYCIHARQRGVPVEDVMLAQKLLIETNEEEFLRIANRSTFGASGVIDWLEGV